MRIIINADDFGFSQETVQATIECFEAGGLTGATIMPKMAGTQQAIEFARENRLYSFGVHLTFTSDGWEHPVLDPAGIPGIVGENGQFLGPIPARTRALRNKLPVDQIAKEMFAQIALLRDSGVEISHVDSHGHLHKFKPFRQAMKQVLPTFGITRVRSVQDVYLKAPLKSPTYWLGRFWRQRIRRQFTTTDHFFMPTSAGEANWPVPLLDKLAAQPAARTLEVGVHPGRTEPWRNEERIACVQFAQQLQQRGHELVGWKDI